MITDTLGGRVKLAFANGLTDDQIAKQEGISIDEVADILKDSRLPVRITGLSISASPPSIVTLTTLRTK